MMNKCVVLMPLSCYKKNELYKHVETFELANPKLFADASISNNLCICKVKKTEINKYSWIDLVLKSVDQRYIEFYKWNIKHNIGLKAIQQVYKSPDDYKQTVDFIDSGRCVGTEHGYGYHAKTTSAYKWNTFSGDYAKDWLSNIMVIHFNNKQAKDNYCKYVYNYDTDKYSCLESKVMSGLHIPTIDQVHYFFIPQINWSRIHINQKELWDKGLYDEAVLSEMRLKYDSSIDAIIKI